ncbi:MAG: DUF4340 domain-containing protein [Candidatus Eremiobacteraeota bacterium]|nr:DUF4340 domain-containing protein [Candidatus Eremiobacteraeota bacterium]MCL5056262.1 DUF4340 domain-containing protein [Bacillota bacterium]
MKKSTLIFFLLFLALLGYLYYLKQHPPSKIGLKNNERIFSVKPGAIQSLEIKHDAKLLELKRSGKNAWDLIRPFRDWASSLPAENLAETFSDLRSLGLVSQKEKLSDYGLSNQSYEILAKQKVGPPLEIKIGDQAPTGQGYYAFVPSQKKLCLVSLYFGNMVKNPLSHWRSKALLRFKQNAVWQIEIQSKGKPLVLRKKKQIWALTSPIKGKADSAKAQGLLSDISGFRLTKFSSVSVSSLKHKVPKAIFSIWIKGETKPVNIEIFKKTKEGYLARSSPRIYPYFVGSSLLKELEKPPIHYLNLHLLSFKESSVMKLETRRGKQKYLFEKVKNEWKILKPAKTKVKAWKANLIVNDLKGLEKFFFSGSPPAAPAHPAAEVTFWENNGKKIQILIGEKAVRNGKTAYPVEVSGSKKYVWGNARLLMKDIP